MCLNFCFVNNKVSKSYKLQIINDIFLFINYIEFFIQTYDKYKVKLNKYLKNK